MMNRWLGIKHLVIGFISLTLLAGQIIAAPPGSDQQSKSNGKRLDIYGDPLPPGAVARFGSLRLKHSKPGVHAVCYSPDGKMIASGGEDKTVRLWEAATGKLAHIFEGHRFPVTSVAISSKGDTLASGDEFGGLMLWNLKDHSVLYRDHRLGSREIKLAFSPDGTTLAAVDQGSLFLIPTGSPSKIKRVRIQHFHPMWSAWSPDGKTIALFGRSAFDRRDLVIIDSQSGEILAEPESEPKALFPEYSGIVFSPEGDTLFTIDSFFPARRDYGGGLTAWKWADGKLEEIGRVAPRKNWEAACSALSHHPKQPLVAYYSYNLLILQNWKTRKVVGTASTERGAATAFSPDGRFLATAGAVLRVWTVPDLKPVFNFHPDVLPVSFSKDSDRVAVGNVLWDLRTYQPLHVAENAYAQMGRNHFATHSMNYPPPNGVRIIGGEKTYSYSFNQQHLRVVSVEAQTPLVDCVLNSLRPSPSPVQYLDFSDNMKRVVFRTWDEKQEPRFTTVRISNGAVIHRFQLLNSKSDGSHLTLSPDGRTLVTALPGERSQLYLFGTSTGASKQLTNFHEGRLRGTYKILFSSQGDYLALYFPKTGSYFVFRIPEGQEVVSVLKADPKVPYKGITRVQTPAFSEEERFFAVVERNFHPHNRVQEANVSVWDLKTGVRLWQQKWGEKLPQEVTFSGHHLLVSGDRLAVWDASSGRLVLSKTVPLQNVKNSLTYQTAVLSPENRLLLAGRSDGVTELIDPKSGDRVGKLTAHSIAVHSCHFTPNSGQVITMHEDQTALLWNLPAIAESAP